MTTILYGKTVRPITHAAGRRKERRKVEAIRRELIESHIKKTFRLKAESEGWIDIEERMPEINDKVLIYQKDNNIQLVGTYLGNGKFHYADCCQGIQKTCSASHWMQLPEPTKTNSKTSAP